jgi:diguanylate cyclase (GGDEF)-like protein
VLVLRDVSELKLAREKLNFMATHDPLTGLPNRFLLGDRLRMAIANAQRHGLSLAVILLDLDNFKTVNDTLGHTVGDELLRSFAATVGRCLRTNDTVARLGGDEFVVVLSDLKSPDEASLVVDRILAALREPFHIESHELYPTASFGISIYPNDGESVETLLRTADTAMYSVKEGGKNDYRFFSTRMEEQSYEELLSPKTLRRALITNQFCLYYQPVYDLETGAVVAAEALLRWRHSERGLLSAGSFIPAAESSGLIATIDEWVIRKVCEQKIAWLSSGVRDLPISVNVSTKFFQREGFVELTSKIFSETGVIPSGLIFELTESAAVKDIDHTRRKMGRLTDLGVRFIIHDFGTSYASLRWLKTVPIYAIKLDKFFVQNLAGDSDSFAIMRAIISMAHTLNFEVIAEGIETKAQAEQLKAMDWKNMPSVRCNQVQGFFFSHPMTPEDFAKTANQSAT